MEMERRRRLFSLSLCVTLPREKDGKESPGEVLQKVEKEAEMISEGHLEAVAAAWQEEAETREFEGDGIRV